LGIALARKGVPAEQPVLTDPPEITQPSNRWPSALHRKIVRLIILSGLLRRHQQQVNLGRVEPEVGNIKPSFAVDKVLEFNCKNVAIPTGEFGEAIVGDNVGALLGIGKGSSVMVGTCESPRTFAASTLPCPAMIMFVLSIRTGLLKPKRWIEVAICRICLLL
jgi:hypothetical protein